MAYQGHSCSYRLPAHKHVHLNRKYIEDFYFFEANTKFILSCVLKTSEFSRVHSTSESFDVLNSRDDIYLVFTEKK